MSRRLPGHRMELAAGRRLCVRTLAVVVFLALSAGSLAAQKQLSAGVIPFNETISDAVAVVGSDAGSVRYRVQVPQQAFALNLAISGSPADLDIVVYDAAGDLITFSELTKFNEELQLSRLGDPALRAGIYDIEIIYQLSRNPVIGGVELTEIPFEFTATLVELSETDRLRPGQSRRGTLEPERAMADLYRIDVPTGTFALRIDISDTVGDLDLYLSREVIPFDPFTAEHVSQSIRSTENLIIDRDSLPRLRPGTYYLVVLDQLSDSFSTNYTVSVSGDPAPPALLTGEPEVPQPSTDMERALMATVELLTDYGAGSGVIVSSGGYILSNWHVVVDDAGRAADNITVGMSVDPGVPADERFRAEVVAQAPERDLALLRIVAGRWGQELPPRPRFPFLPLRAETSPNIGDDLHFIGYPWIGGTGSRATVTYTRGVVAGFQEVPFGRLIKTDAVINEGSSGGAALDREMRLVGLPTEVVGFDTSQIAYIYPVASMPAEWRRMITRD